jgi:hypothetical protein
LRVYDGKMLRAVIDSVVSFRDAAIPLARQIRTETGNASWTKDSLGNFKAEEERNIDFQLEAGDIAF